MKTGFLWSRDHPRTVLVVLGILTLFFAAQLPKIRLDASTQAMMIETDPARVFYQQVTEVFGSDNLTIIYVKDPDLFTHALLSQVETVFYNLQDLPGVARVDGLFNGTNFKGEGGMLNTDPLLDWVPNDQRELDRIKADALRSPLFNRMLIAPEESALAIIVTAAPDPEDQEFDRRLADAIDATIAPLQDSVDDVFQVGVPLTRRFLSETIQRDFIWTSPFFYLLLFVVLMLGVRTVNGVVLPMLDSGISIIWTLGFMVLADIPLNMITWVVPALVFILGSTEDIHLLAEYRQGLEHGYDRMGAIGHMAEKCGLAVFLTSLTTFFGFLSITVNDITILKQFGLATAFGMFVNPLVTFSLAPVYLRFMGEKKAPPSPDLHPSGHAPTTFVDRLGNLCVRGVTHHPLAILSVFAVGVLASIVGILNLKVDNDLIGYFRPHTALRQHSQQLHRELAGMQNFYIVMDAQRENGFKEARNIQTLFQVQKVIADIDAFDLSVALSDHIALVNREMANGQAAEFRIPEQDDLIAQYLLFFTRSDLERYVSPDFSQANIHVRHNLSSSHDLNQALATLQEKMDALIPPPLTYTITGESILFNNAADSMASGQAYSLGLILVSIFIVIAALFVRLKAGLAALVPNIIPILFLFGLMGLCGVPLNPGTAMIAACAVGIAVDDTIHMFTRYRQELTAHSDPMIAVASAIRGEFRPVFTTSLALALGFSILGFSSFIPMSQYGWLSAVVMILALASDILITPILLSRTNLVTPSKNGSGEN